MEWDGMGCFDWMFMVILRSFQFCFDCGREDYLVAIIVVILRSIRMFQPIVSIAAAKAT